MIKRRLLSYDISQLTKAFKKDFPQLVTMAEESESAALFKKPCALLFLPVLTGRLAGAIWEMPWRSVFFC